MDGSLALLEDYSAVQSMTNRVNIDHINIRIHESSAAWNRGLGGGMVQQKMQEHGAIVTCESKIYEPKGNNRNLESTADA